MVCQHSTIAN